MLARNKDLQLLLHGFSFYLGMYVLTLVCLDQLLKDNLSQSNIGWIGFTYVSCEIFGIFVSGVIVNKFKCFCLLSIAITFCALLSWVGITVLLLYFKVRACILFGIWCGWNFFYGFHIASHFTFHISLSESTTGAIMFGVGELHTLELLLDGCVFNCSVTLYFLLKIIF